MKIFTGKFARKENSRIFTPVITTTTTTMKSTIIELVNFLTKKTTFFKAEAFTKLFFYAGYESTLPAIEEYLSELVKQDLVETINVDGELLYCAK